MACAAFASLCVQIAGPDGTISHLMDDSRLAVPQLMDGVLPVLGVKVIGCLPSSLQQALPASLTARKSWGLTPTEDRFAIVYFACLVPACLFVAQRIGRVAAALRQQQLQQCQQLQLRRVSSCSSESSCYTAVSSSRWTGTGSECTQQQLTPHACWRSRGNYDILNSCLLRLGICAALQVRSSSKPT